VNAKERLEEIKRAAVSAFDELWEDNATEIMDAESRAKAEGVRQGKEVKFKVGFRVVINDADHEAKHTLGWSFGFKRTMTTALKNPDQPDLPGTGEPATPLQQAFIKAKRKRAKKGEPAA
jgi:hypothetical protein